MTVIMMILLIIIIIIIILIIVMCVLRYGCTCMSGSGAFGVVVVVHTRCAFAVSCARACLGIPTRETATGSQPGEEEASRQAERER